ncbi:MAG: deoxyhypusine synthase family protein [Actinomycetota bacterium]|nr:deoxyhypusine synthase family protein [Actinomycetota bacterium]MDQ3648086.1 deoxyhypusine synthase family protein [Actinomycetota bacterium]
MSGHAPRGREEHLARALETIEVRERTVSELLEAMGRTGFQGRSLAACLDVLLKMISEPANTIFLGYAGSLSTTGQWKIVSWLIENRFVDAVVSTGANVSEDVFEGLGFSYFQGSRLADDAELLEHRIDRYLDVYADERDYRRMEEFLGDFLATLAPGRSYSSAELLHLLGAHQLERGVESITTAAFRAGVPVFSPGLADSAYGVAAYLLHKQRGIEVTLDSMRDFVQLGEIGERTESTSVIYIGGGVPKDTIQLVTVMADLAGGGDDPQPHRYAIQITTDSPQWGGLSGCTFEEAVSWGKIDPYGDHAVCYCDATIALPLLAHALAEKAPKRRTPPSFGWLLGQVTDAHAH